MDDSPQVPRWPLVRSTYNKNPSKQIAANAKLKPAQSKSEINATLSPLLRLPGELRNRIYQFTAETESILVSTKGAGGIPNDDKVPARTSSWSALSAQYLGLTQTCRQLRAEFLGLYRAATVHRVYPPDLAAYIKTFLHGTFPEPGSLVGNVLIDMEWHWDYEGLKKFIDLLPLTRLFSIANHGTYHDPKLKVHFRATLERDDPEARALEQLVTYSTKLGMNGINEEWRAYVLGNAVDLLVAPWKRRLFVILTVNNGQEEEEVAYQKICRSSAEYRAWIERRAQWQRRLGLGLSSLSSRFIIRMRGA